MSSRQNLDQQTQAAAQATAKAKAKAPATTSAPAPASAKAKAPSSLVSADALTKALQAAQMQLSQGPAPTKDAALEAAAAQAEAIDNSLEGEESANEVTAEQSARARTAIRAAAAAKAAAAASAEASSDTAQGTTMIANALAHAQSDLDHESGSGSDSADSSQQIASTTNTKPAISEADLAMAKAMGISIEELMGESAPAEPAPAAATTAPTEATATASSKSKSKSKSAAEASSVEAMAAAAAVAANTIIDTNLSSLDNSGTSTLGHGDSADGMSSADMEMAAAFGDNADDKDGKGGTSGTGSSESLDDIWAAAFAEEAMAADGGTDDVDILSDNGDTMGLGDDIAHGVDGVIDSTDPFGNGSADGATKDIDESQLHCTPHNLRAIANYLRTVAAAAYDESKSKSERSLYLSNGRMVESELTGEHYYHFDLDWCLDTNFITTDINPSTSNSSSYCLQFATEWHPLLHVNGHEAVPVQVVRVSASGAGTGSGTGITIKSPVDLSDASLDKARLCCDENKFEIIHNADQLVELAERFEVAASGEIKENTGPKSSKKALAAKNSDKISQSNNILAGDDAIVARIDEAFESGELPELTARLASCIETNYHATAASQKVPVARRLDDYSENSLELSPDLSSEQQHAVATALNYDLSFIVSGAQGEQVTVERELILNLMAQRKSVLVVDRDPRRLGLILQNIEQAFKEQETLAEAYGDTSSIANASYSYAEADGAAVTVHEDAAMAGMGGSGTNADIDVDADADADADDFSDLSAEERSVARATAKAHAAAARAAQEDGLNIFDNIDNTAVTGENFGRAKMQSILKTWNNDYPVLLFGTPQIPVAPRVTIDHHIQKRLGLLNAFCTEQQSAKKERLANLGLLLSKVKWLCDSKLEELSQSLKNLSSLKRERAEQQNLLNHMHQHYEHQQDLLFKALTPHIMELRDMSSPEAQQETLTMQELMDYSYEEKTFHEVEEEVKRLWQKIHDDQKLYQDLKAEIQKSEQQMREIMYRARQRQVAHSNSVTSGDAALSLIRGEYTQLKEQRQALAKEYEQTTQTFNNMLRRLHLLKPQHQLMLKFEALKEDTKKAVAELTERIEALHAQNVTTFEHEQQNCLGCGYELKERTFGPQAWRELITCFLNVKHDVSSTQNLMDNWRLVADGTLQQAIDALGDDFRGNISPSELANILRQKFAEDDKAKALREAQSQDSEDVDPDHAMASMAEEMGLSEQDVESLTVDVDHISAQLSQEEQELKTIESQLKPTREQIKQAHDAIVEQCPVIASVPNYGINNLTHCFDTVIISAAHLIPLPEIFLISVFASKRLVIISDLKQMGSYAHLRHSSHSARTYLYPEIMRLCGIKDTLAAYNTKLLAATKDALAHLDKNADIDEREAAIAAAEQKAGKLPCNIAVINHTEQRHIELTTLLNLYYGPYQTLSSDQRNQTFVNARNAYYQYSNTGSAGDAEHAIQLIDTYKLHSWIQEMQNRDYSYNRTAPILRHNAYNIISAAFNVLLAFKLVANLLVLSKEDEEARKLGAGAAVADATASAASNNNMGGGDIDDIDALLAANAPAPTPAAAATPDIDDIDALLAANGGGAALGGQDDIDALLASTSGAGSTGALSEAAAEVGQESFVPHLVESVERDPQCPECALNPRVIIVSAYPQQAALINFLLCQHYKQLGCSQDFNLIAVTDAATLASASADAVIFDLTITRPFSGGMYFDAPATDPAGRGVGPLREEFLSQHLSSALSAARYSFYVVGDIERLLKLSRFKDNLLYQLFATSIKDFDIPLKDAHSVLPQLMDMDPSAQKLSFELRHVDPQSLLTDDAKGERNYSDSLTLVQDLVACSQRNQERADKLGLFDKLIRAVDVATEFIPVPTDTDAYSLQALAKQQQQLQQKLQQAGTINHTSGMACSILAPAAVKTVAANAAGGGIECEVACGTSEIHSLTEDAVKKMLQDVSTAKQHILVMTPILDRTRYESLKPHLAAAMRAGKKVVVLTSSLDRYPDGKSSEAKIVAAELREMTVNVVYGERCFYQGVVVDDEIMWLTTFPMGAHCEDEALEHSEMMVRLSGSIAKSYYHKMYLPLLMRNLPHMNSCPICGSKMHFNAQYAQLLCTRKEECGFMLLGDDELSASGELLCTTCHSPMEFHVINKKNGTKGFALRCSNCTPPVMHALSSHHLKLPSLQKQIKEKLADTVTLEEIEQYVSGQS